MSKYRYTVINPENKQLTGTISAPDEKSAREELNQLGFSIISINVFDEQEENTAQEKPVPKFEFAAIDKNMKRIVGTIQAENRYSAFKRLVREYLFEVEYLFDTSLPDNEKDLERRKGTYELQNKLDGEDLAIKASNPTEDFDINAFNEKQKVLQLQVDFVLKKVKEILDLYEHDIKPETKEKIRHYVDKILRIKNSTNLDYIRTNCEDLLNFLQKEELFLHEEERLHEHAKLSLEAKSLMHQLHRKQDTSNIDIGEKLGEWRQIHITDNPDPSAFEKFINIGISLIIGFEEKNEDLRNIRQNIKIVNGQIKQYIILYFQAASTEYKIEAREGLKRLFQERKKLKKEYSLVKKNQETFYKKDVKNTFLESLALEIETFSGWLLAFYLSYYFISFYITTKDFGNIIFPPTISIYRTTFLKYFLVSLFLFHSALSIKNSFFRRNQLATFILSFVFLLGTTLTFLNF